MVEILDLSAVPVKTPVVIRFDEVFQGEWYEAVCSPEDFRYVVQIKLFDRRGEYLYFLGQDNNNAHSLYRMKVKD